MTRLPAGSQSGMARVTFEGACLTGPGFHRHSRTRTAVDAELYGSYTVRAHDPGTSTVTVDFTGYWRAGLTQDDPPVTGEDLADANETLAAARDAVWPQAARTRLAARRSARGQRTSCAHRN